VSRVAWKSWSKRKIALAALLALGLAQLIPVERTNPAVESEVPAPPEVREILRRTCYDCHSNESRWPWYAHVAPISWLVVYDVNHAREHLNFSTWNAYGRKERAENLEEAWEEVEEGEMPLWIYRPLHPEARLSDADKRALRDWALAASQAR
jgi:hypothetical protein